MGYTVVMKLDYPPWHPDLRGFSRLRSYWKQWNCVYSDSKKKRTLKFARNAQRNRFNEAKFGKRNKSFILRWFI